MRYLKWLGLVLVVIFIVGLSTVRIGQAGGTQHHTPPATYRSVAYKPVAHHAGHRHRHRRHHHHRRLNRQFAWDYATASWYNDAGQTASSYHAYYGVANKYLAFGTRVTFKYNGRIVTATVDDRGPYIAGRDFDLNQNTAAALGFDGVDTVGYVIR